MSVLSNQYMNSNNFMTRVELNRKFGTNPHKWTLWYLIRFNFQKKPE